MKARLSTFLQAAFVIALVLVVATVVVTAQENLRRQNIATGFGFLFNRTGWDLGASLLTHATSDPYWWTFLAGLLNTVVLSVVCILLATTFGLLLALAASSGSRILTALTGFYIWIIRNTPILVQVFFWYQVTRQLPPVRQAISILDVGFITIRGFYVPALQVSADRGDFGIIMAIGMVSAIGMIWLNHAHRFRTGLRASPWIFAAAWIGLMLLAAIFLLNPQVSWPQLQGFNFAGGTYISPEFCALVVAITVYNTAFVAEIVRAGIRSIPRGQVEAARIIGLSEWRIFWKIIMPQALRVAVPPLTNQYISITKSSSLAIAIGYTDLFSVGAVAINHTGQSIEIIAVLMAIYLSISLGISAAGNWYNRRTLSRVLR